jgi:hypothetical protein
MSNYLYGNTPSVIYKELLGIGGTADRVGISATLKSVWTDDGAGSANSSSFTLSSNALRMESTNQLRFRDDAIYIYSSGDTVMNLVADGEIDLATAAVDVNATSTCEIDNTNTTNGVKVGVNTSSGKVFIGHTTSETTVNDNLTVTGTTAHTEAVTVATGVKLQFVDANEYLSGNSSDLTIGASSDINLTAGSDVNVPSGVGLTFGNDGEKIEGDGTDLLAVSSGAFTITAGAASTWSASAGALTIDASAASLVLDGHTGAQIISSNSGEVDITSAANVDINATTGVTVDGTTVSIDGTDDSNVTVTGSDKDLTISVVGGSTQKLTLSSAGTGADAISFTSTAGGIDVLSTGGTSDIDIANTGGSVNISATENVTDAIVLSASAGGIDIIASSAEDIDITGSGGINISSTENDANAIYLHADGGTGETIKIYADQGTADTSIYLLSDAGSITIDSGQTSSNKGVLINTATSGGKTYIGHTTSEVYVGENLTVTGTLTAGSVSYTALTLSHATATVLTLDNQETSDSADARDITFKFTGNKASGASVDDMAHILVAHEGSSSDEKGYIDFKTNTGAQGTSPGSALKLSADNTATFTGAITAGTNQITCGQLRVDNLLLDGNVLSSTDTNGNIAITPHGSGAVSFIDATVAGDYAFGGGKSCVSSGNYGTTFGLTCTASGATSFAAGQQCTASGTAAVAIGNSSVSTSKSSFAVGLEAKADRVGEMSHSAGRNAATGDTRGSFFHTFSDLTMSSSWQSLASGTGGIEFDSDSVACCSVLVIGSTSGAAVTVGYIVEFIAENDGGTYAIVGTPVVRTHETEDTSLDCQVAVSSSKLYIQVTDSASTPAMRWSAHWHIVQHTY